MHANYKWKAYWMLVIEIRFSNALAIIMNLIIHSFQVLHSSYVINQAPSRPPRLRGISVTGKFSKVQLAYHQGQYCPAQHEET
jgi:hypothetical protein